MKNKFIKDYLSILNIHSINQLEENDLDYWHQKKFIEIQRSSRDKELISKQLIQLNTAKDFLDSIELNEIKETFRNKFQSEERLYNNHSFNEDEVYD